MRERHEFICNLPVCSNCSKIAKYYPGPLQTYDLHQKCARKSKNIHICHALLLYVLIFMILYTECYSEEKNTYFAKNEIPYRNFETTK